MPFHFDPGLSAIQIDPVIGETDSFDNLHPLGQNGRVFFLRDELTWPAGFNLGRFVKNARTLSDSLLL
jgi:hypothetical protein